MFKPIFTDKQITTWLRQPIIEIISDIITVIIIYLQIYFILNTVH